MGRFGNWRGLGAFAGAQGGNVAIIFAAVMIPVGGIAAAAIDFGRAGHVRSVLQIATSSAAQAASAHLDEARPVIEKQVQAMLAANLPPDLAALPHQITIAGDRTSIEVAMATTVPTTLMGMLGVPELGVEATGFAKRPRPVPSSSEPIAGGAPATPEVEVSASRALGALLGGALPQVPGASGFGAAPLQAPALSQAPSPAQLEAAVRDLAEQLRGLERGAPAGAPAGLPPAAAAEIERVMRDLGSIRR